MVRETTRQFRSNCWVTGVWLWLVGKVDRLAVVVSPGHRSPHLIGFTRSGHVLAFGMGRFPQDAQRSLCYPLWFRGQIRGCRRRYVMRVFGKRRCLLGRFK